MVFRRLVREVSRTVFPALLVLLTLAAASSAWAVGAGKIVGRVTSKGGEGLTANVIVLDTKLGGRCDENGNFVIPVVPVGTYSVRAMIPGYTRITETSVAVDAGKTVTLNFSLPTEAVQVAGSRCDGHRRAPGLPATSRSPSRR